MDCWIASFPRSGNTYFRNILYFVYGIESSTFHKETSYPVDDNYQGYRFVKTHLLPNQLTPDDPAIPAIYLIRDGRDAMVSIAHHRSDLVKPGSDFTENLKEAIIAAEGSFFGGWSENAEQWISRAQLIIRYEDLIADPPSVFKLVEKLIPLPPANWNNLPTFEEMKAGKARYGSSSKRADAKFPAEDFANKFFRKGKSGGWKTEMPDYIRDLFWNYHGETMERMGYHTYKNSVSQNPMLDYQVMKKMGLAVPEIKQKERRIYLEATKVIDPVNDGIKRYLQHLLLGLVDVNKNGDGKWIFKLFIERKIYSIENYKSEMHVKEHSTLHPYEEVLMGFKKNVKKFLPHSIYQPTAVLYRKSGARAVLTVLRNITSVKRMKAFYKKLVNLPDPIDILHIPLPQNSEFFKNLHYRFLVTVHDLTHKLFPQYHEKINIDLAEAGMQFIMEKKAEIIVVSDSTRNDLISNYPVKSDSIHLAYEAPDRKLFRWNLNTSVAETIRAKYKIGKTPFFLSLSTIEPRKNLPNTIKAFNQFIEKYPEANVNLVISGNFGWKTEHLSEELHLNNSRIIFTGYIPDEDLPVLYSEALALCYISHYEGFGLPPLEAMRCRTPVIYGRNSSMTEIIGEAGLSADPNNLQEIVMQMHAMYFDKSQRDELAVKSHHRSFEFSDRKSLFDTLNVYLRMLDNNHSKNN